LRQSIIQWFALWTFDSSPQPPSNYKLGTNSDTIL
jgi:hypothetical protein